MAKLLLINGPNLNLLGNREPGTYGTARLDQIVRALQESAARSGHQLDAVQSNAEHELIERIQRARSERIDYILINPAAFTHTSIAIRDALLAVAIPFVELHLSNVHAREPFRHRSYFSDIARGVITGFGAFGYELALQAALHDLNSGTPGAQA